MELTGTALHPGSASGDLFVLHKPLSFWGGMDPLKGIVADPRHPQYGTPLSGRILVMERTIGSSSSSAIMLELLRNGVSPAGIVLGRPDAILMLGILVARELGYPTVPVVQVDESGIEQLARAEGDRATITDGVVEVEEGADPD
ncbi:MAG: DUF126 domain-containing protein [Gemmatimonadota bacterium]|nr:DUF126 domain-containing protein [Gemmatimonadota bacterium]